MVCVGPSGRRELFDVSGSTTDKPAPHEPCRASVAYRRCVQATSIGGRFKGINLPKPL